MNHFRFLVTAAGLLLAVGIVAASQRDILAATTKLKHVPGPTLSASRLSMLHADGTRIVDADGHPVALRGINLGGWLVEEPWMEPFVTDAPAGSAYPNNKDHVSIWSTAKSRFGQTGMEQIRDAFRQAWITPADFDRMQAAGMNCVRVPFLASLADEPNGLRWLDNAVNWAGQHSMYVILDMHGMPGSQSKEAHTGQAGTPEFFTNEANVRSAMAIWSQIASRYKNNPAVAGYDMMNEPMGTPNSDTLYVVEDHLYRAIRSVDTNHIVFFEDGYTGMQGMPFPVAPGWKNVAFSSHYYDFNAKSEQDQESSAERYFAQVQTESTRRNVPWYVGEFGLEPNGTPDVLAEMLGSARKQSIATSMWTFKTTWGGNGQQNLWGLYSNTKPIELLNMFTDSKADLIRKCAQYRTENLQPNRGAVDAFTRAASVDISTVPALPPQAQ